MKKISCTIIAAFCCIAGWSQNKCERADLQAVSISPASGTVEPGKTVQVQAVMHNNGPCIIPAGMVTAEISMSAEYLSTDKQPALIDLCKRWSFVKSVVEGSTHTLYFQNRDALPVGGVYCDFIFDVKAKSKEGNVRITLNCSIAGKSGLTDANATNQSVYVQLTLKSDAAIPIRAPKIKVELKAKSNECTANLSWTADRTKIDSFQVETGYDKTSLTKAGSLTDIQTAGTNEYKFDVEQGSSNRYYRIKIFYKDKEVAYSNIEAVETKCKVKRGF